MLSESNAWVRTQGCCGTGESNAWSELCATRVRSPVVLSCAAPPACTCCCMCAMGSAGAVSTSVAVVRALTCHVKERNEGESGKAVDITIDTMGRPTQGEEQTWMESQADVVSKHTQVPTRTLVHQSSDPCSCSSAINAGPAVTLKTAWERAPTPQSPYAPPHHRSD